MYGSNNLLTQAEKSIWADSDIKQQVSTFFMVAFFG